MIIAGEWVMHLCDCWPVRGLYRPVVYSSSCVCSNRFMCMTAMFFLYLCACHYSLGLLVCVRIYCCQYSVLCTCASASQVYRLKGAVILCVNCL